jgi:hypothetical protein
VNISGRAVLCHEFRSQLLADSLIPRAQQAGTWDGSAIRLSKNAGAESLGGALGRGKNYLNSGTVCTEAKSPRLRVQRSSRS